MFKMITAEEYEKLINKLEPLTSDEFDSVAQYESILQYGVGTYDFDDDEDEDDL